MTGPGYFAAAAAHLEEAESFGVHRGAPEFERHMRLFEANATMARLALDAAKAVAGGDLIEGIDVFGDEDETDPLTKNANAWVAAVAEGGAR